MPETSNPLHDWTDEISVLVGNINKARDVLIAVREELQAHMVKVNHKELVIPCHECMKIKTKMIECETEFDTLQYIHQKRTEGN